MPLLPPVPRVDARELYLEAHGVSAAVAAAVDTAVEEGSRAPLTRIAEILADAGGVTASQHIKRTDLQRDYLLETRAKLELHVEELNRTLSDRDNAQSKVASLEAETERLRDQLRALSLRIRALVLQQRETAEELDYERRTRLELQRRWREHIGSVIELDSFPAAASTNGPPVLAATATPDSTPRKWVYRDPQHELQGPFDEAEILEWYASGLLTLDLPMRPADGYIFTPIGALVAAGGALHAPLQRHLRSL